MKKWFVQVLFLLLLVYSFALAQSNEGMACLPAAPSTPAEDCISKDEAVLIAKQEMAKRYDRSVSDFDFHKIKANFVRLENNEDAWVVMIDHNNDSYDVGAVITLSPSGETILHFMSNDDKELIDILLDQWKRKKGNMLFWSIEDEALFNWLFGSSEIYLLPSKEHISQEKATEIALSAIPEILNSPQFSYSFKLLSYTDGRPDQHAWRVTIIADGIEKYVVYVSAVDGSVIDLIEVGNFG